MGIRVYLAVDDERVSEARWREIYEKARRVAREWIPRPLSLAWRDIGAVQVEQYCLDVETPEGLYIVGDAESLTTAESFLFPARLERAARGERGIWGASGDDVLVAVASWLGVGIEGGRSWCELFGDKTQGLPYHALVIGLGLLVEHELPGAAVVYGDISRRDGEGARRGLGAILGEEIALPVVVDGERLRRRLAVAMRGEALEQAVRSMGPLDPYFEAITGDLLGLLRSTPDARVCHELENVVLSCPDPDGLSAETRMVLRRLVGVIHANIVRWELRERIEQWGLVRTREALARRTSSIGMCLTSMAWDAIEVAGLDELAFLYMAACMDTTYLGVRQAVRAVIENRAVRRA
jgi:hypothetical protein